MSSHEDRSFAALGAYERALRSGMVLGAIVLLGLLAFGLASTPQALRGGGHGVLGAAAAATIIVAYAAVGFFGAARTRRLNGEILRVAIPCGLAAGFVYAGEVLLEYVLLPRDNTRMGLIEFGLVLAIYFFAGLVTAGRTRKISHAVRASVWSALIATMIWYVVVLVVFYAFRHTPRQEAVFRAEGNFEDFKQSGLDNFDAFIMQDFLGAGFFHLLLSPVAAAILGTVAGSCRLGFSWLFCQLRSNRGAK